MISRCILAVFAVLSFSALPARAQTPIPPPALAAEQAGRWDEAVAIYRASLAADQSRIDLWIRIADIEARRGNLAECIAALERASSAARTNAPLYERLSQAYSMADRPAAALSAIEVALVLTPNSPEYLRARATLATWIADYDRAADSYRRLQKRAPEDADLMLALARVCAWGGHTGESVAQYRRYLKAHPLAPDVWLELAKTESWRGNYAGAVGALSSYRLLFGESPAYSQTLATVLAAGGRPGRAEGLVAPLLAQTPDSVELNLARTIALAMQRRPREAFSSLDTVRQLSPESRDTRSAQRLLRTMLASTVEPEFSAYSDSDRLQVQRFAPRATFALLTGTRLSGGYERVRLTAPASPTGGLGTIDGTPSTEYEHGWIGAAQQIGRITLDGQGGYATAGHDRFVTYRVGMATRVSDTFWFGVHRSSDVVVISPRTVSTGLTQIAHRLQVEWTPTLQTMIVLDGSYAEFSDGNRRLELTFSPRRSVARRDGFNLDLGVSAYRLETDRDLANGYYDPRRYEHYAVTAYPYFKISENIGLSLSTALGVQRDAPSRPFRFGGTAAGEATFGIYDPWTLKVNASASMNQRLQSGAFGGVSGGVVLVRRF